MLKKCCFRFRPSNRNTKQYSSFGATNRVVRAGSSSTLPPNVRPNWRRPSRRSFPLASRFLPSLWLWIRTKCWRFVSLTFGHTGFGPRTMWCLKLHWQLHHSNMVCFTYWKHGDTSVWTVIIITEIGNFGTCRSVSV